MYIRARGANSFTGGNRKTAAARRAHKSRDKLHVFVGSRISRWDLAERFTPMSPTRARLSRAHAHTSPKKDYNRAAGARRGEQKRQKAEDATRTQRHAPASRCRKRIVPKRSLRTTGKEGKREESGRTKNPSQLEVVRDWRRVTDGIRTHDIQNHNLTL